MGLVLKAVSKDYGYNEEKDDYIGEGYLSTDIGYGGFKMFRNNLAKWASNNVADDTSLFINNKILPSGDVFFSSHNDEDYLAYCFYDSENYTVLMDFDQASEESKKNEKFINYIKKLDFLKKEFPKLYTLYPFIFHCDCQGEVPLEQCEQILPLIKEFHETDNRSYGYSGWEYNFVEDLISVLEEVITHKGKLLFE